LRPGLFAKNPNNWHLKHSATRMTNQSWLSSNFRLSLLEA